MYEFPKNPGSDVFHNLQKQLQANKTENGTKSMPEITPLWLNYNSLEKFSK